MGAAEAGPEPWKSISRLQLYISEHNYAHRTRLVFDVGEVSLLRLKTPVLAGMDAPHHLMLPRKILAIPFDVIGTAPAAKGSYTLLATLEAERGAVRAEARQDLADPHRITLPLSAAEPGAYTLRLSLLDAAGKKCSESAQPVMMHAGPLY